MDKILLKVNAALDEVCVELCNDEHDLARLSVNSLAMGVVSKQSYIQVSLKLGDVAVLDRDKDSRHNKVNKFKKKYNV